MKNKIDNSILKHSALVTYRQYKKIKNKDKTRPTQIKEGRFFINSFSKAFKIHSSLVNDTVFLLP